MTDDARMQMSIHAPKWWGSRWLEEVKFQSASLPGRLLIRSLAEMWQELWKAGLDQGSVNGTCPRLSVILGNC